MTKRYEVTEAQWERIADLLPGKAGHAGRTATDNRLSVNGVLWVLRSGAYWRSPREVRPIQERAQRFSRWAQTGV